jgi:hypothetical protein
MIARVRNILALALMAAVLPAHAAERYRGVSYDLATGALLYREVHYVFNDTGQSRRLVLYECADGRPFARKQVQMESDAQAPEFEMIDARRNYREGVRRHGDTREAYVQRSADVPEKAQTLDLPPDAVIDAGFDEFIRRHWEDFVAGKSTDFPFLVPSRRAFYSFKIAAIADEATVLRIRLSLGAWYAFLLPHIDVVYDRATRHLQKYEGMSNVRDENLKNYSVRTQFVYDAATASLTDEIETALKIPLATDCSVVRADTSATPAGH